jgi:hypothetical protein
MFLKHPLIPKRKFINYSVYQNDWRGFSLPLRLSTSKPLQSFSYSLYMPVLANDTSSTSYKMSEKFKLVTLRLMKVPCQTWQYCSHPCISLPTVMSNGRHSPVYVTLCRCQRMCRVCILFLLFGLTPEMYVNIPI